MNRRAKLFVAAAAGLIGAAQPAAAQSAPDAAAEYRLTIDGEVYNVPVEKAFAVMIGGKRVTMRLDPQTQKPFRVDGVEFAYPPALQPVDPVDEGGVAIWSFEGPSVALMLQRYDGELAADSLLQVLADNIADQYGGDSIERQSVQLRGAERAYPGQQLRVKTTASAPSGRRAAAVDLVQNVFTFASGDRVYALIVQDTRPSGEGDTEEYRATLRLLGETLKTAPATKPTQNAGASQRAAQPAQGSRTSQQPPAPQPQRRVRRYR